MLHGLGDPLRTPWCLGPRSWGRSGDALVPGSTVLGTSWGCSGDALVPGSPHQLINRPLEGREEHEGGEGLHDDPSPVHSFNTLRDRHLPV